MDKPTKCGKIKIHDLAKKSEFSVLPMNGMHICEAILCTLYNNQWIIVNSEWVIVTDQAVPRIIEAVFIRNDWTAMFLKSQMKRS